MIGWFWCLLKHKNIDNLLISDHSKSIITTSKEYVSRNRYKNNLNFNINKDHQPKRISIKENIKYFILREEGYSLYRLIKDMETHLISKMKDSIPNKLTLLEPNKDQSTLIELNVNKDNISDNLTLLEPN